MGYYAAGGYYPGGGFFSKIGKAIGRINVGKLTSFVAKTPLLQSAVGFIPGGSTILGGLGAVTAMGAPSQKAAVATSNVGTPGATSFATIAGGVRKRLRRIRVRRVRRRRWR
jgi:hypothetical protein